MGLKPVPIRDTNLKATVETMSTDTRSAAISLMSQALQLIDSDAAISGVAGAQLQMAIDSLSRASSRRPQNRLRPAWPND